LIVQKSDSPTANPNAILNPIPNPSPGRLSDCQIIEPSDYRSVNW